MEVELVLQRVLVPFLGSLIGCGLLVSTDQGDDFYDDEPVTGMAFRTIFGALICGLGMVISDLWSRGMLVDLEGLKSWTPRYQWEWMIWAVPASMLIMALVRVLFTIPNYHVAMAGTVFACLAVGLLFASLREGDVWQDQQAKMLPLFALGSIAMFINANALNTIACTGGSRWGALVVLAQLGCVTAIIFQAYGSLGEWSLVGVSVALGASIAGLVKGSTARLHFGWPLSIAVQALGMMAVVNLVVSRFFETPTLPDWLLLSVLFLPTLAGGLDFLLGRMGTNVWVRAVLAAILCAAALGAIIYFAMPMKQEW
jgi:hypothetical protein